MTAKIEKKSIAQTVCNLNKNEVTDNDEEKKHYNSKSSNSNSNNNNNNIKPLIGIILKIMGNTITSGCNKLDDDDNGSTHKQCIEKKKVRFLMSVQVILIPSRNEYIKADLLHELWWKKTDFPSFKSSAIGEIIAVMRLRNIKNCKEAMRILYQNEASHCNLEVTLNNCDTMSEISEKTDSDNSDIESPPDHLLDKADTTIFLKSSFRVRRLDEDDEDGCSMKGKSVDDNNCMKRPIKTVNIKDKRTIPLRHVHPLAYMIDEL